jgi:hypothetical protein
VKPSFKLSWEPLIFQQNISRRKIPQQCYRNWPNLSRQLEWELSVSLGRTIFRDRKSNYAPVWTISQNITAVPWKLKVPTQFKILKRKRHSKAPFNYMLKSKFSLSRHFEYANEQITYHFWLWGDGKFCQFIWRASASWPVPVMYVVNIMFLLINNSENPPFYR